MATLSNRVTGLLPYCSTEAIRALIADLRELPNDHHAQEWADALEAYLRAEEGEE
jgi:hypothetical protein